MKNIIAHRAKAFSGSEILEFFTKAKGLKHPIDLSIGMPHGEMTETARSAAILALRNGHTKYSPAGGMAELRIMTAQKLRNNNNLAASTEDTIMTAGVSGGLFLAMAATLDPGDEIIIPDPFFVAYRELAILLDAKPVFLDTYPDFDLDLTALESLISDRTKAILINTPNNPTGKVYAREKLQGLADICRRHGLIVISDEIYEDFVFDTEHCSIGELYQPTITLNGFSKNHAMTGMRMGYAHSTPEIIRAMLELQQFVFFSNSSVAEHAALAALGTSTAPAMRHYAKNREYVLKNLSPEYVRSSGEGSFFFFIKHPFLDGRQLAEEALKHELIVLPGNLFSLKQSHFRISYACDMDRLVAGIEILNSLVVATKKISR